MAIYSSERPRGEMLPLTDEQRQQPQVHTTFSMRPSPPWPTHGLVPGLRVVVTASKYANLIGHGRRVLRPSPLRPQSCLSCLFRIIINNT